LILTRATDRRPARWQLIWLVPLASLILAISSSYKDLAPAPLYFYFYLVCCVGTLLVSEQLIRSESGLVKTIGISIGGLFLFNLYIYAIALIEGKVSVELIETRSLASATVALVLCLAPLAVRNSRRTRKIGLSRPLIFTTSSLLLAGASLVIITALGFVLQLGEKQHGPIIQQFSGFIVVLILGFYFSSAANRARARVWINKHFFRTKHDYNSQWRALSERLSAPNESDDYIATAIKAVASIYHSSAGACYIADGGQFTPI